MKKVVLFCCIVAVLAGGGFLTWKRVLNTQSTAELNSARVDEPGVVTFHVGEEKRIENLIITLKKVSDDSRCPVDVECITEGNVFARMSLRTEEVSEEVIYGLNDEPHWFAGYFIDITAVYPESRSNEVIDPLSYSVAFTVKEGRKPGIYAPLFEEYPVDTGVEGTVAPIEYSSYEHAELIKDTLEKHDEQSMHFAGHYRVVSLSCGDECQSHTIINNENGKILALQLPSQFGVLYSATSSLFVVNSSEGVLHSSSSLSQSSSDITFPLGATPSVSDYYHVDGDTLVFLGKFDVSTLEKKACQAMPITGRNPLTMEEVQFNSLCDVPYGYEILESIPPEEFEKNGETWKRERSEDFGFSFEYRTSSDGYVLIKNDITTEEGVASYELMNVGEYESFKSQPAGGESPPSILIRIFEEADGLDIGTWIKDNPSISNFDTTRSKLIPTKVGGIDGFLYNAEGLYQSSIVVVSQNGKIYMISGSYRERSDPIYRDFDYVIASILFF